MTEREYIQGLKDFYAENVKLSERKMQDYTGGKDPFANFRASEVVKIPLERAILVRIMDKVVRVSNLLENPPKVKNEGILDSLSDIANYCAILAVYISKGRKE